MSDKNDNVVEWGGITRHDLSAERLLQKALETGLDEVVILGFDNDGNEYFASSKADGANVLWHLKRAEFKLLKYADDDM